MDQNLPPRQNVEAWRAFAIASLSAQGTIAPSQIDAINSAETMEEVMRLSIAKKKTRKRQHPEQQLELDFTPADRPDEGDDAPAAIDAKVKAGEKLKVHLVQDHRAGRMGNRDVSPDDGPGQSAALLQIKRSWPPKFTRSENWLTAHARQQNGMARRVSLNATGPPKREPTPPTKGAFQAPLRDRVRIGRS